MNEWTNIEIMALVKALFMVSVCVVIISAVNYTAGNDKKQDIKTIFIGLGMMVWSLVLHICAEFGGFDFEGADKTIWLCAVIPIIGGANGLAVLKLLRFFIYKKIKRKWEMTI